MYHISADKRSRKSAELIWDGMEQCLREKSLDKLRISDIYQKSYISRATFYRLFDSVKDVLVYECDQIYDQLAAELAQQHFQSKHEFFLALIEKWMKQEVLVKTLVENNMVNVIYETHMKNRRFMKDIFLEKMTITEKDTDYLVSLLATLIPASINVWYLHGKTETPQEVYHAVCQSLNIIGDQLIRN